MKEILYLVCEVRGWLSMFTFFGYMPHAAIILEVACRFSWTQRNCVVLHFGWLGPPGTRLWRHQERGTTSWGRFGIQMITALQVSLLCFWCIFLVQYPFGSTNDMNRCIAMKRWLILGLGFFSILGPSKSEMYQAFKAMELKLHLRLHRKKKHSGFQIKENLSIEKLYQIRHLLLGSGESYNRWYGVPNPHPGHSPFQQCRVQRDR